MGVKLPGGDDQSSAKKIRTALGAAVVIAILIYAVYINI